MRTSLPVHLAHRRSNQFVTRNLSGIYRISNLEAVTKCKRPATGKPGATLSAAAQCSRCEIANFLHVLVRKKRANRIRHAHLKRAS
jgi:hypothetical protein